MHATNASQAISYLLKLCIRLGQNQGSPERRPHSLCLREKASLRSSRLSLPRFGSDRPRIFRRIESILEWKDQLKRYVWLQRVAPYFCARLVTKTEGHPSHAMARSPPAQMTRKLLPGPMRRASPAQRDSEMYGHLTKVDVLCTLHCLLHCSYLERTGLPVYI